MRKLVIVIPLLALLWACGQPERGATQPDPTTSAPIAQPTAPIPTEQMPTSAPGSQPTTPATMPPAPTETSESAMLPSQDLIVQAHKRLARHLNISEQKLTMQGATAQEWPNSALGCPKRGSVYTDVIVPGFLLVFSDGAQTYEIHADSSGSQMVLCQNKEPVTMSDTPQTTPGSGNTSDPASQQPVDSAKQALATELGVKNNDISVIAVEAVEWNDSSLGCPKPGEAYMSVITPGYRVVLEAQGKRYTYHTDATQRAVRCDK